MKFGTIVVDPPWSYERTSHHHKLTGYATEEYPLLSTAELAKLPIGDLADDDCVLLLWATWPFVPDALSLCEAWGFSYVTGLPWVKTKGEAVIYGVGYWLRGATEPILVAKRGKAFRTNFVGLIAPGLKHSRKPDDIYELGNSLPGPHLEIFARSYDDEPSSLAGWYQLGYEVATDGSDIRDRLHQMLQMPDYRWEPFRVNGQPPKARPKAPQATTNGFPIAELHSMVRDGARHNHPSPTRYRAVTAAVKNCLACNHWARFHPGHGPCEAYTWEASRPCPCTEFDDPQPGRPDQIYTREQIERMPTWRWNANKHRIFLLRDGHYGLWDQWSTEDWKAKPPPKVEVPPEPPEPVPEPPQKPPVVSIPPEAYPDPWNLLDGSLALPGASG